MEEIDMKWCPYCGEDAIDVTVNNLGKRPSGVARVSLCDGCGRFEWL